MKRYMYLVLLLSAMSLGITYDAESRVREVRPTVRAQEESQVQQEVSGNEQAPETGVLQPIVRVGDDATIKYDFDIEGKRKQVLDLLAKAVNYFNKTKKKSFTVIHDQQI